MSKWKCEICGNEFENFHAQGFDNKIHCPLCYFKKLSADLQVENQHLKKQLDYVTNGEYIKQLKFERDMLQDLVNEEKLSTEVYDIVRMANKNMELAEQLKQRDEVIDEAIEFFDTYKQEVVIGRNKDEKLIKDYLLPSQYSNGLLEILQKYKGDNNE